MIAARLAAALVSAALVSITSPAQAQTLPVTLDWRAPAGCPGAEDIQAGLARVARARPGSVLEPLRAQGDIEVSGSGFVLRLSTEIRGERGQTVLEAARCEDLERAATLVLALVLGDAVELVSTQEDSAPAPTAPLPPATLPVLLAPQVDAPPARPRLRVAPELELGVAAVTGMTPDPALGPRAGLLLRVDPWLVRGAASAWFSQSSAVNERIRATFWAASLDAGLCYQAPISSFRIGGCLGGVAGVLHGSAEGARRDASALAPWYAVRPSLLFGYRQSTRLELWLETGLALVPAPPRFVIDGVGVVFDRSWVAPFIGLGVGAG